MAVTKILARHARLDLAINYAVNPDKTDEEVLTAYLNCDKGHACHQMLATKEAKNNRDGVQYYHIIQSFKPGEITPELALEVAQAFAKEHLADYEVVIGVHVDKEHIHAHMVFNSVNLVTGRKYHSNAKSYYQQIRTISDKLCREHGLSVIMEGKPSKAVSYIEWLRQSKGQPTFRSMLEADLRDAIADANDLRGYTDGSGVGRQAGLHPGNQPAGLGRILLRHIQNTVLVQIAHLACLLAFGSHLLHHLGNGCQPPVRREGRSQHQRPGTHSIPARPIVLPEVAPLLQRMYDGKQAALRGIQGL